MSTGKLGLIARRRSTLRPHPRPGDRSEMQREVDAPRASRSSTPNSRVPNKRHGSPFGVRGRSSRGEAYGLGGTFACARLDQMLSDIQTIDAADLLQHQVISRRSGIISLHSSSPVAIPATPLPAFRHLPVRPSAISAPGIDPRRTPFYTCESGRECDPLRS
jgi:hypothetical protein